MRKKSILSILSTVIAIFAIWAVPTLAAWIGTIYNEATIKEPLSTRTITSDPQEVFPGQEIFQLGEIKNNTTNITYGLRYQVWAFYNYYTYGLGSAGEAILERPTSEDTAPALIEKTEKLTLELGEMAGGGTTSTSIGELTLFIDPDGLAGPLPEQKYVSGQTINILPGGTHSLKLKLNVSLAAYPGSVVTYIDPYRTAPVSQ